MPFVEEGCSEGCHERVIEDVDLLKQAFLRRVAGEDVPAIAWPSGIPLDHDTCCGVLKDWAYHVMRVQIDSIGDTTITVSIPHGPELIVQVADVDGKRTVVQRLSGGRSPRQLRTVWEWDQPELHPRPMRAFPK